MNEFTNSVGKTFKVKPFPQMLNAKLVTQVREQWEKEHGKLPPVPTYEVKPLHGAVEVYEYKKGDDIPPADKEKWDAYERQMEDYQEAVNQKRVKAAVLCIDTEPNEDKDWVSRMRFLGIDIPEDYAERMNLYADTEVFADTRQDKLMLLVTVAAANDLISQEVVSTLSDGFFRANQRRKAGRTTKDKKNETEQGG